MFDWIELCSGVNYETFIRIRTILDENQMENKTKVTSTRERMANNVILGGSPLNLNITGTNAPDQKYTISIKKKEIEKAKFLIRKEKG